MCACVTGARRPENLNVYVMVAVLPLPLIFTFSDADASVLIEGVSFTPRNLALKVPWSSSPKALAGKLTRMVARANRGTNINICRKGDLDNTLPPTIGLTYRPRPTRQ